MFQTVTSKLLEGFGQNCVLFILTLVMALPLKAETIRQNDGSLCYSLCGDWSYALCADESMKLVVSQENGAFKAQKAPVKVLAKVCKTGQWVKEDADAGAIPIQPECRKADELTVELVPYGCTDLRIAQFATAKLEEKDA